MFLKRVSCVGLVSVLVIGLLPSTALAEESGDYCVIFEIDTLVGPDAGGEEIEIVMYNPTTGEYETFDLTYSDIDGDQQSEWNSGEICLEDDVGYQDVDSDTAVAVAVRYKQVAGQPHPGTLNEIDIDPSNPGNLCYNEGLTAGASNFQPEKYDICTGTYRLTVGYLGYDDIESPGTNHCYVQAHASWAPTRVYDNDVDYEDGLPKSWVIPFAQTTVYPQVYYNFVNDDDGDRNDCITYPDVDWFVTVDYDFKIDTTGHDCGVQTRCRSWDGKTYSTPSSILPSQEYQMGGAWTMDPIAARPLVRPDTVLPNLGPGQYYSSDPSNNYDCNANPPLTCNKPAWHDQRLSVNLETKTTTEQVCVTPGCESPEYTIHEGDPQSSRGDYDNKWSVDTNELWLRWVFCTPTSEQTNQCA